MSAIDDFREFVGDLLNTPTMRRVTAYRMVRSEKFHAECMKMASKAEEGIQEAPFMEITNILMQLPEKDLIHYAETGELKYTAYQKLIGRGSMAGGNGNG